MIKELITSPWMAALVVLFTQFVFIYFRTLNVIFTAERNVWPSIATGAAIGAAWLVAIAIGANAVLEMQWQPILAHLIGGACGTWWAFRNKKVKK
tara:strand:- start:5959 stop:6243 length:285 start_codon:yes stop_codon:yes gene_type:complete